MIIILATKFLFRDGCVQVQPCPMNCDDVTKMTKFGFEILEIIRKANTAFGPLLFLGVGLPTVNLALHGYFVFTVYTLFDGKIVVSTIQEVFFNLCCLYI